MFYWSAHSYLATVELCRTKLNFPCYQYHRTCGTHPPALNFPCYQYHRTRGTHPPAPVQHRQFTANEPTPQLGVMWRDRRYPSILKEARMQYHSPQTLPETRQLMTRLPTDSVFRDEPSESFHESIDVRLQMMYRINEA